MMTKSERKEYDQRRRLLLNGAGKCYKCKQPLDCHPDLCNECIKKKRRWARLLHNRKKGD